PAPVLWRSRSGGAAAAGRGHRGPRPSPGGQQRYLAAPGTAPVAFGPERGGLVPGVRGLLVAPGRLWPNPAAGVVLLSLVHGHFGGSPEAVARGLDGHRSQSSHRHHPFGRRCERGGGGGGHLAGSHGNPVVWGAGGRGGPRSVSARPCRASTSDGIG